MSKTIKKLKKPDYHLSVAEAKNQLKQAFGVLHPKGFRASERKKAAARKNSVSSIPSFQKYL